MERSDLPAAPTDAERIAELEDRSARLERDLARGQELLREASARSRAEAAESRQARRELDALRRRRSVRLVLGVSARMRSAAAAVRRLAGTPRRAVRTIRRRMAEPIRQRRLRASTAAEAALVASIRRDLAPAAVVHGPLVTIVILNRDGREHLERCLLAVAATAYRDVEIVVVDNGSTDGSAELAERFAMPFPVTVLRNPEHRSFSEANGQAAAIAAGELICFLNNDVDPITEHWLGYLVETLTTTGAAAVGARLIYPRHRGGRRGGARFADLTVQHAGVAFDRADAIPMPRAIGAGEDPLAPAAQVIEDRPALTAACLLVRRPAFEAVGGFSAEYDYGIEDVDLCLRLRAAGGRLVYDGRAALWHHESATRATDRAAYLERVARNREVYVDTWGVRLFRAALLDAIAGSGRFSTAPFHVAITLTSRDPAAGLGDRSTGHGLGGALEALGWRVTYLESAADGWHLPDPSVEAVIVLLDGCDIRTLPRRLLTLAWISDSPERWLERPWFDEFDLVFAATDPIVGMVRDRSAKVATLLPVATDPARSGLAEPIRDALLAWASATRYGLRIGVPNWDVVERWGDYHFARALQRSLERAGHPTRLHLLPDWDTAVAAREDVTVHLFGLREAPTRRCQVNLLWQISHPDLATPEMYDRYDHVFVASDRFAARMAPLVEVPVRSLHQATDPERFRPDPTGPRHELLFVANSRHVRRRIVDDLAGTTRDLAVYGRGWTADLIDPRFVKGEGIPNADVGRYYSSAAIVLNDHWDDMRDEGFMSNRLYDAVACGAFVISDDVDGVDQEFDGAVVTYRGRAELERLIARYLGDPSERHRSAERGRRIVLERHTFDVRARTLCETADRIGASRPAGIASDV